MKIAAIEAGGTKFVLAIGDENGNVLVKQSIPTTTPEETFKGMFEFFDVLLFFVVSAMLFESVYVSQLKVE